jgi:hypothetical protein
LANPGDFLKDSFSQVLLIFFSLNSETLQKEKGGGKKKRLNSNI